RRPGRVVGRQVDPRSRRAGARGRGGGRREGCTGCERGRARSTGGRSARSGRSGGGGRSRGRRRGPGRAPGRDPRAFGERRRRRSVSRREALATADRVRARLAERGTAVDDPASALDALERSWGREPDVEAAAVAWLGAAGGADAGARLQALAPRTESKAVKTEIRRALYRLEQRGLWSPPSAAPPPSARHLLGPADDEPEAWLSEIDPTGTRLLWMARRAGDGVASLSAVVNDVAGILEFHAGETTRKALRQAHRDLASRSKIALVEAPWRHVDALLAEAHEKSDQERFADVTRARRVIAPERAPGDIPAPVDSLLDRAAVAADADALRASAEALRARGAGSGWLLPAEWLTPVVEAVDAARTSLVVVSPAQQEERAREALEHGLADALAAPERRRL